ncbi:PDZ domain-containing protein, partial [candidate division GN15 bacterium]|nr:PDZ domain-containing protein [candidate division GN15 bacterium]
ALESLSDSFEALSDRVTPAIVQIISTGYTADPRPTAGAANLLTKQRSTGSGVILSPDGYIVTNAHVVDGAQRIQVLLPIPPTWAPDTKSILKPHGEVVGAQIVGVDYETDLAVLRVYRDSLPHLTLGNSDNLRQGELVFAFGSPLGLENSVSMGVVSAVARQLAPEDPMIYIQTDAPINPGNSGGPLINTAGEVVGINTFIFSQSGGNEGIGFAAPSNIVENIFNQFKENGIVQRGQIGIHAQTVTPMMAAGLDLAQNWGVIIGDVFPNSPAEKAGLMAGDIVLTLDGKQMENGRQFDVNLYQRAVGEKVSLVLLREADTLVKQVAVIERAQNLERFLQAITPENNLIESLGILGVDFDERIAEMLPRVRVERGVVIAANTIEGLPFDGGLRPGDVIFSINRQRVESMQELREQAARLDPGDAAVVQVDRFGRHLYVSLEVQ